MPIIQSNYKPPLFFKNRHLQTIFPANFRKIKSINYKRERIATPDNDFLDLDWSTVNSNQLAIILHGFEGDSQRDHIKGMVKAFNTRGWDSVAMNQRSCSGEPNRLIKSYHGGATADLDCVISHIIDLKRYQQITLIGFSLGGNIVLKYLGEKAQSLLSLIGKAACISAPCDLGGASVKVSRNPVYYKYFIALLYKKLKAKMAAMPGKISIEKFKTFKSLMDFDDVYTAPDNGFKNANDYYTQCSSIHFLKSIAIPTLILNAKDDPFLSDSCFPINEAKSNNNIFLEIPAHGGHTGFMSFNKAKEYYSEQRVAEFIAGNYEKK